jgi:hypothetical protein
LDTSQATGAAQQNARMMPPATRRIGRLLATLDKYAIFTLPIGGQATNSGVRFKLLSGSDPSNVRTGASLSL